MKWRIKAFSLFATNLMIACSNSSFPFEEPLDEPFGQLLEDNTASEFLLSFSKVDAYATGNTYFAKEVNTADSSELELIDDSRLFFYNAKTHICNKSISIALQTSNSNMVVHCTTDGSVPTNDSPIFQESIPVEKNSIVRCTGFEDNIPVTPIETHTFIIDSAIKMPIVSITVDPVFLKEYYINNRSTCAEPCRTAPYWEDIEFPVHVEYFSKGSQSTESDFEIDAGISFAGNYSRWWPKKSVKIEMRQEYQEGKLVYPLFDTRPEANKFKSFLLRNNGSRFGRDFYGDAAATRILEGTGLDYQRSQQVVVFYNGRYYGIHDLREKINKHFIETNHGIDDDIVTIAKHNGNGDIKTNDGTNDYYELMEFILNNSFDKDHQENYNWLEAQIDMNNFADYIAYEVYAQNDDWPHNNVRAWKTPSTLWKFIVFDIDYGFDYERTINGFDETETMFEWIRKRSVKKEFGNFFTAIIENPKFKQKFLHRSAILFNRFFNSENVEKAVDKTVSQLDPDEMDRDLSRFHRTLTFYKDGETMKTWAKQRDIDIWEEYKKEFDLPKEITLSFNSIGHGKILIEGRSVPGNYTGKFFGDVDMILTAEPDEGFIFDKWEDGSRENPRTISPTDKAVYTATFR